MNFSLFVRWLAMNVEERNMEEACKKFKSHLGFNNRNVIHVAFSRIDTAQNKLLTICTDYNWHLEYWSEDMYKSVGKRCEEGVNVWNKIDEDHKQILKNINAEQKVDITTSNEEYIDILSLASNQPLSVRSILNLSSLKPQIGYLAQNIWHTEKPNYLNIPAPTLAPSTDEVLLNIDISQYSFGGLTFSEKEMQTIQWLLQLKSIKEIAWIHRCSETAERKRIESIKRKLNCSGKSSSYLFNALKKSGIAQALSLIHI